MRVCKCVLVKTHWIAWFPPFEQKLPTTIGQGSGHVKIIRNAWCSQKNPSKLKELYFSFNFDDKNDSVPQLPVAKPGLVLN